MKVLVSLLVVFIFATFIGAESAGFLPAWEGIRAADLARHIAVIASDEYEGREPGTAGEQKTLRYLEDAFRKAGAGPGFGDTYLQPVPLVELKRAGPPDFAVTGGKDVGAFVFGTDFVASAGRPLEKIALEDLPVVFAGYGATAKEFAWDDYASEDLRGAAVILLRGEPGAREDTTLFRGRALTRHGLPATKYDNAARHGGRAAIVIHTDASAGYPWTVLTSGGGGTTQNFLEDTTGEPKLDMVVHVSAPAARRMLAAVSLDLDTLIARAGRRGFRTMTTPLKASMSFSARTRRITSHNVVARIEGRAAPDECVIYTGHWDHVGRNDSLPGDKIFNGAVDNATGTAALLELAQAFAALPVKPRRTVYFVATTAEEKGLLGSEFLARHPLKPLEQTVAVLNLDALFPFGSFNAMTVTGFGSSELEDVMATAAARIGRVLQDDSSPEAGAYYRSDHYPFAKRGVPALFAVGNPRDDQAAADTVMTARFNHYLANGYHKVDDEYDAATWDLSGVEGDVRIYFETGLRIADSKVYPNWRVGNEFRALRDEMRKR